MMVHGISIEYPEQGPIVFSLIKSATALLRYFILAQSIPILKTTYIMVEQHAVRTKDLINNVEYLGRCPVEMK